MFLVSSCPSVEIQCNSFENLARRRVELIENHSVPRFPYVPEQQEKEVHAECIRQSDSNANVVRISPTLVVGGELNQLKNGGSLSPLGLAFGV